MVKKTSENPFFRMDALLSHMMTGVPTEHAYNEHAGLFATIGVHLAEVANRTHVFLDGTKKPSNGQSKADQFDKFFQIFLAKNAKNDELIKEFIKLCIGYIGLRPFTTFEIKTQKGKKNITGTFGLLSAIQKAGKLDILVDILIEMMGHPNPMFRIAVAKFVAYPKFARKNKKGEPRKLQAATLEKMKLYKVLVDKLHVRGANFRAFKKAYGANLIHTLFSQKAICDMDKVQVFELLNALPSGSRHVFKMHAFKPDKTANENWKLQSGETLASVYEQWEAYKLQKQQELRELEAKGVTTVEDKLKIAEVAKAAKVTTGANTIEGGLKDILSGKLDEATLESIERKVQFNLPILPVVDVSGSMDGVPLTLATLLATLAVRKNSAHQMLMTFSDDAKWIDLSRGIPTRVNRFSTTKVVKELAFKGSFLNAFRNMVEILQTEGSTNVASIAKEIRHWIASGDQEERKEILRQFPIVLIITDRDFNNASDAKSSLMEMTSIWRNTCGFDPVIVVWSVVNTTDVKRFASMNNVIEHRGTLGNINALFEALRDGEPIDSYLPLKKLAEMYPDVMRLFT